MLLLQTTQCGRYIVSRDYMTLKLWDLNMGGKPVVTIPVHDHLRPQVCYCYYCYLMLLILLLLLQPSLDLPYCHLPVLLLLIALLLRSAATASTAGPRANYVSATAKSVAIQL
jgi:hypothetical protein